MSSYQSHEQEIRDLYADDPFVESVWFGRMIEEAQEVDRVNAQWAEAAEDERAQLGELEDPEL